jgi:hypothetical protein
MEIEKGINEEGVEWGKIHRRNGKWLSRGKRKKGS